MGLELELHSQRPRRGWKASRATLIRGSYEHGEALAELLTALDHKAAGKLWWVDLYGDTVFNEQEAEAALGEIPGLLQRCSEESQTAAVHDLADLLRSCARTPGSYLWFVGD